MRGRLEVKYQTKFLDDLLSVLRETLIHVLEAIVTEERRCLLLEIMSHKCKSVGEMASIQLARRHFCTENYDRIEQTLRYCMDASTLPENLNTRCMAILLRSYIAGIIKNWLFAPESLGLKKGAREYVAVLLETYLTYPTLRPGVTEAH